MSKREKNEPPIYIESRHLQHRWNLNDGVLPKAALPFALVVWVVWKQNIKGGTRLGMLAIPIQTDFWYDFGISNFGVFADAITLQDIVESVSMGGKVLLLALHHQWLWDVWPRHLRYALADRVESLEVSTSLLSPLFLLLG
jgi:hypothetical protein